MAIYIVRRLVQIAIALFAISSLIFLLFHLQPGGPCGVAPSAGFVASPSTVNCVDYFHLDEPLIDQYLSFLGNYLHLNLGTSLEVGAPPVGTIIGEHLPTTIILIVTAFTVQQIVALPLGMLAAVKRYSFFDGAFSVVSYIFLSLPAFILGFNLIYLFAVEWHMLPAGQSGDDLLPVLGTGSWFAMLPHQPALLLGDMLRHLTLPAATLAVVGIALDSRFMRASMLQVLDQEYIRTAKAKGVPRSTIIFKHAFRNALPPIITSIALYFPALIGSAMVVEYTFSYSGIGYTFTQAIRHGNTTLEQGVFLVTTVAVLLANLGADIAYGVADPRVHYE